ncbi:MAG: hypothetical protein Q7T18_05435 [Sedimentisphaerales bacterium]|nr:hypothetical protein [Sedimentisphaerales bacterium]
MNKTHLRPVSERQEEIRPAVPILADAPIRVATVCGKCQDCRHYTPSQEGSGGMCSALAYNNGSWHRGERKQGTRYGVQKGWSCCKFEDKK